MSLSRNNWLFDGRKKFSWFLSFVVLVFILQDAEMNILGIGLKKGIVCKETFRIIDEPTTMNLTLLYVSVSWQGSYLTAKSLLLECKLPFPKHNLKNVKKNSE